jgi:hypothetical protein
MEFVLIGVGMIACIFLAAWALRDSEEERAELGRAVDEFRAALADAIRPKR